MTPSTVRSGAPPERAALAPPADPLALVELITVPPASLLPTVPDLRDREGPDYRAFFDSLVADVKERGVVQPVIAFRDGGALRVWDGWTRSLAALMARLEGVPCLAHPARPAGELEMVVKLQSNALRLEMDEFEYAACYQQLQDEHGWGRADLASRLKVSPSLISKRMRLFNGVPPDVRCLFGRGPGKLGGRAAYAVSRLPDDESKRELARLASDRGLKVEALEALVAERVGKKPKGGRPFKASACGLTVLSKGPTPEALRAFHARFGEALRRAEKEPHLFAVFAELLKG